MRRDLVAWIGWRLRAAGCAFAQGQHLPLQLLDLLLLAEHCPVQDIEQVFGQRQLAFEAFEACVHDGLRGKAGGDYRLPQPVRRAA